MAGKKLHGESLLNNLASARNEYLHSEAGARAADPTTLGAGEQRAFFLRNRIEEEVMDKPSIGRIVIYNHPGSSDGKYPPQKSPAIIQNVAEDGTVRLFVFGPKGQHMDEGLTQGDGPCQWNWPNRV